RQQPALKGKRSVLASHRPRQQCRPGPARAEEEDAARGHLPRDEAAPQLREALRTARPRKSRSRPPLPQAHAQAHGPRRLLDARIRGAAAAPPATSSPTLPAPARLAPQSSALTMSSHTFLASPNSIIVLSRKNSSFSMPA